MELPDSVTADGDFRPGLPEVLDDYGFWHLDRKLLTLTLSADSPSGYEYEIDLERFVSSGEMLDFIMQIASKSWATPEIIGTFVMALNDIFYPQANLCTWGQELRIKNIKSFLRKQLKS